MSSPNPSAPIFLIAQTLRTFYPPYAPATTLQTFLPSLITNQPLADLERQRTSTVHKAFYNLERANAAARDIKSRYVECNNRTPVFWEGEGSRGDGTRWFAVIVGEGREMLEVVVVRGRVDERVDG